MDVDTRLLRYFAAVASEGNLTRAAERLFVSQPALTKQIKPCCGCHSRTRMLCGWRCCGRAFGPGDRLGVGRVAGR